MATLLNVGLVLMCIQLSATREEINCETHLIETIDLHQFMIGNKTIKDKIGKQFDSAMTKLGFLYLSNHGVTTNIIDSLYNASNTFFHLPSEEKNKYSYGKYLGTNGYHPFGYEKLDKSNSKTMNGADLVENYYICNSGYDWYLSDPTWQDIPPQFVNEKTNIIKEYAVQLRLLLSRVHTLAAYALNLKRNYFEQYLIDDIINGDYNGQLCLRLNYYFAINETELNVNESMRLGAHSDYRSFTLLYIDEIDGLQAKYGSKWINVVGKKDTFILNAGDFIELWTLKKWRASIHRVSPITNKQRISLTYFSGPRGNVIIEPFTDCVGCRKTAQQYLDAKYKNAHYD